MFDIIPLYFCFFLHLMSSHNTNFITPLWLWITSKNLPEWQRSEHAAPIFGLSYRLLAIPVPCRPFPLCNSPTEAITTPVSYVKLRSTPVQQFTDTPTQPHSSTQLIQDYSGRSRVLRLGEGVESQLRIFS